MTRVLVCGGRDFSDAAALKEVLDSVHAKTPFSALIHGKARGADYLAGKWAESRGIPTATFQAKWETYGKSAGPIRNALMIKEGHPDLVIAFPGGNGTADMVRQAQAANILVLLQCC